MKTDHNAGNIYMKTGSMEINQRKDIEMTVKPLSFCTFFCQRNKCLGPFSISNKFVGPVLT